MTGQWNFFYAVHTSRLCGRFRNLCSLSSFFLPFPCVHLELPALCQPWVYRVNLDVNGTCSVTMEQVRMGSDPHYIKIPQIPGIICMICWKHWELICSSDEISIHKMKIWSAQTTPQTGLAVWCGGILEWVPFILSYFHQYDMAVLSRAGACVELSGETEPGL